MMAPKYRCVVPVHIFHRSLRRHARTRWGVMRVLRAELVAAYSPCANDRTVARVERRCGGGWLQVGRFEMVNDEMRTL